MIESNTCWICNGKFAQPFAQVHDVIKVDCSTCGPYNITGSLAASSFPLPDTERHRFSFWNKQRELDGRDPVTLDAHSIEAVISGLPVYATHQKPDILLVSLSKKYPRPGTYFKIDSFREYTLACASGMDDVGFFQKALIQRHHLESAPPGLAITHAGWDRIASVSSSPLTSKTAFVAMSFNDEMLALWRPAFHAAIDRAKFEPRIANDPEHNDQIDAKIVAEIKQCRFLVADTTFASAGVYFEAGYALGLGKPVIWTCRRDRHKEDMHFDTRQYNNVLWDKAEDLADKLYYRISATI